MLKIDPEFKSLIPPLTADELSQLEANLIADGCRDPLVVWGDIIIDGHNRLDICTRNKISFATATKDFPDRDTAKVWIIRNQFGRRNLTLFVRAELALKLEPLLKAKAKANQQQSEGRGKKGCHISDNLKTDTKKELARIAGTSHNTIYQVKVITEKADEATKEKLRMGQTTINKEYQKVAPMRRRRIKGGIEVDASDPDPIRRRRTAIITHAHKLVELLEMPTNRWSTGEIKQCLKFIKDNI